MIELAPGALRPADIIGGEAAAMLDVPDDLGLQLVALLLVFLAQAGGEARGAQGLEDLRRIGEMGVAGTTSTPWLASSATAASVTSRTAGATRQMPRSGE